MLVRSKKGFQLWLITSRHTEPEASSTFGWNILCGGVVVWVGVCWCVGVWVCGCVGVWVRGCVGVRVCGCVDV
jgi:hypothetical protein